jgi:hypothetical protein
MFFQVCPFDNLDLESLQIGSMRGKRELFRGAHSVVAMRCRQHVAQKTIRCKFSDHTARAFADKGYGQISGSTSYLHNLLPCLNSV